MKPIVRNLLAVLAGILAGSLVNMGFITLSPYVIPPPSGVDVTDMESLRSSMHLFEPRHFVFPFLAHALGTLAGAFTAFMIAAAHRMKIALGIGAFFLIGGVVTAFLLPSPIWFIILDLAAAYLPMGWLGGRLADNRLQAPTHTPVNS